MKMNKIKYFAVAMFAGLFLFTACEDDDPIVPGAPTVTIDEGAALVLDAAEGPVYDLEINVSISAPGKIKEIKIERNKWLGDNLVDETSVINQEHFDLTETSFTHSDNINYEDFLSGAVDMIEYVIIVTDKNDKFGDASYAITMGSYTALTVEVEGEIWKLHGNGEACWDLLNDEPVPAYDADEQAGSIDLSGHRYLINSNVPSTPGETETNFDGSWSSDEVVWDGATITGIVTPGNGTLFVKANDYDYENAPKEVAIHVFGTGTQSTEVEAPEVGDIYIAMLGEELYVLKVTELDVDADPNKANTGVLKFTYKK